MSDVSVGCVMMRSQAFTSYQYDGNDVGNDGGMLVKSLTTSSRQGQAKAPHLHQPNIVSGVSAGGNIHISSF